MFSSSSATRETLDRDFLSSPFPSDPPIGRLGRLRVQQSLSAAPRAPTKGLAVRAAELADATGQAAERFSGAAAKLLKPEAKRKEATRQLISSLSLALANFTNHIASETADPKRLEEIWKSLSAAMGAVEAAGVSPEDVITARLAKFLPDYDTSELRALKSWSLAASERYIPQAFFYRMAAHVQTVLTTDLIKAEAMMLQQGLTRAVQDGGATFDQLLSSAAQLRKAYGQSQFTRSELRDTVMQNLGELLNTKAITEQDAARLMRNSKIPPGDLEQIANRQGPMKALAAECLGSSQAIAPEVFFAAQRTVVNLAFNQSTTAEFSRAVVTASQSVVLEKPGAADRKQADLVKDMAHIALRRGIDSVRTAVQSFKFDFSQLNDFELSQLRAAAGKLGADGANREIEAHIQGLNASLAAQWKNKARIAMTGQQGLSHVHLIAEACDARDELIRRKAILEGRSLSPRQISEQRMQLMEQAFNELDRDGRSGFESFLKGDDAASITAVLEHVADRYGRNRASDSFVEFVRFFQNSQFRPEALGNPYASLSNMQMQPEAFKIALRSLGVDPANPRVTSGRCSREANEVVRKDLEDWMSGADPHAPPGSPDFKRCFTRNSQGDLVPITLSDLRGLTKNQAQFDALLYLASHIPGEGEPRALSGIRKVLDSKSLTPIRDHDGNPAGLAHEQQTWRLVFERVGTDVRMACEFEARPRAMVKDGPDGPERVWLGSDSVASLRYTRSISQEAAASVASPLEYSCKLEAQGWDGNLGFPRPEKMEDCFGDGPFAQRTFEALHEFTRDEYSSENMNFLVEFRKFKSKDPECMTAEQLNHKFFARSNHMIVLAGKNDPTPVNLSEHELARVRNVLQSATASSSDKVAVLDEARVAVESLIWRDTQGRFATQHSKI